MLADEDNGLDLVMQNELHDKVCKSWKDTLVLKLLGGNHIIGYLRSRLQQKWAPKDHWQLIDLENNYFLARFKNPDDRLFVLTRGPWMIAGQYLIIKQWNDDFNPLEETIDSMADWIRIANMPMQFMFPEFLERVGNKLGTLLKIDRHTAQQTRGRFAKICVEINLNKPLKTFLRLRKRLCRLEYEGLNLICFQCGRYGHNKEACNRDHNGQEIVDKDNLNVGNAGAANSKVNETTDFGPWMQVPMKTRGRKILNDARNKDNKNYSQNGNGSRFGVLNSFDPYES